MTRAALVGLLVLTVGVGCDPMSLSYFLFRGDAKTPADHPLLPKGDKKEITVAVLVTGPQSNLEFAGVDRELAQAVARKLVEQTKEAKHPFKVIDSSKVDKFKRENPNWRAIPSAEIGKQLGADYTLELAVASIGLFEPGSGKLMYEGQATIEGTAYDSTTVSQVATYFVNPKLDSRPADSVLQNVYKTKLVDRIADEIIWKHIAHASDRRIAPVQ